MPQLPTIATFLCAASLAIAACSPAGEDEKNAAEAAVKERLTDPYSARFSDEFVIRTQLDGGKFSVVSVCGYVNSKNSFGGYTGKSRFIAGKILSPSPASYVYPETRALLAAATASDHIPKPSLYESIYWNRYCVDNDHPATYTGS